MNKIYTCVAQVIGNGSCIFFEGTAEKNHILFLFLFQNTLYLWNNPRTETIKTITPTTINDHCTPKNNDNTPNNNTHTISPAFPTNSAIHEIVHSSFGLVQSETYADIIGRINANPKEIPKVIISILLKDSWYPKSKYNKDIKSKIKNRTFLLLLLAEKLLINKSII